jgi:P-type conjugative transfer protein TrbJ
MKQFYCKVLALGAAILAPPAFAQAVVFDPTNFVQNVIQVAHAAEQIANQVRQLQNEAQMIANQVQNLKRFDFNIVGRLRANLQTTEYLLSMPQGVAFELGQAEQVFAMQYPREYGPWSTLAQMQADVLSRWSNSLDALRTTVRMQAQARQNLNDDEESLADLVSQSQWASGNRDVTQATNQLLALHAKQAIEEQRLRIAEDRAAALEAARKVASEERSRELRRRFMTTQTSYTPVPIDVGD